MEKYSGFSLEKYLKKTLLTKVLVVFIVSGISFIQKAQSNAIQKAGDSVAEKVWDLGFSELRDIKLFSSEVGSGRFEPRIGRDVFRSQDSTQVYRVVDRLYLPLKFPLYELKEVSQSASQILGLKIDTEIGLEFLQIRGIHAHDLAQLPEPDRELKTVWDELDRSRIFDATHVGNNLGFDGDHFPGGTLPSHSAELPSQWIQKLPGLNIENPEVQARLDHFSEIFTHSFRFPFSKDRFQKNMRSGDIVAYTFNGLATFGVSALNLWPMPLDFTDMKASIGFAAGIYGRYRIAVLKENDRFAQVQVSYLAGPGVQMNLGAQSEYEPFAGFFLSDYISDPTKIVPFKFKMDKRKFKEIIHTYRFDLDSQEGQSAYVRAVRGNFHQADQLSDLSQEAISKGMSGASVWKDPVEIALHNQKIKNRENNLGYFYRVRITQDRRLLEFVNAQGETTSRQAVIELKEDDAFIKILRERQEIRYYIKDEGVESNQFRLLVWGKISDNSTKYKELIRYLEFIEKQISLPYLLPRPLEQSNHFLSLQSRFSKVDLNFQLELKSSMLQKFLSLDEQKRWRALEQIFGMPMGEWSTLEKRNKYNQDRFILRASALARDLFFPGRISGRLLDIAQNIEKDWASAAQAQSPERRLIALSELFSNHRSAELVLELLHVVLKGEEVPYSVIGYNRFLGNMNFIGNTILDSKTKYQVDQNFEQLDARSKYAHFTKTEEAVQFRAIEQSSLFQGQWNLVFDLKNIPTAWRLEFSFPRKSKISKKLLPSKKVKVEFSTLALESVNSQPLKVGRNSVTLPEKHFKGLYSEFKNLEDLTKPICFKARVNFENSVHLNESDFCVTFDLGASQ